MIQPVEMSRTLPMTLHGGAVSTTTEVWEMLTACHDGDLDRVKGLASRRPELTTCQYNYTPPLHFAVREGHVSLVRWLVEQGSFDPRYKGYPFGDSLLTMAEDRGHEEIAAFLQETLTQPELNRRWVDTGKIDYQQDAEQIRFDKVVHEGTLKEAEEMLNHRADLARNELSSWAEGVLMMPARGSNRPLLELLLRFGAQVPPLSKWGRFYYFKHDDIAEFLIQNGMSASHRTWHHVTLLHDMAQSGEIRRAELLLDHGADINAIDEEYRSTPLGMAARWGQRQIVAILLKRGADPNKAGAAWSAPLAWALKKGHSDIADDLAAAGAR